MFTVLRQFAARLRAFVRRDADDRELAQEVETHLALAEERFIRRGMTPAEAHRAARIEFGGVTQLSEAHRRTREIPILRSFASLEWRSAARELRHHPWFAIGATLTFALGIGANLISFAVADRVLFRPLPFHEPDRLASVFSADRDTRQVQFSFPSVLNDRLRAGVSPFADLAFAGRSRFIRDRELGSFRLLESSFNLLDVLGVAVIAGRSFTPADAAADRRLALIREEVWSSRFGRDPATIGRSIHDRDRPETFEIIGVLPRNFVAPSVNWGTLGDGLFLTAAPRPMPGLVGRLRPGVSIDDAQLSVNNMIAGLAQEGVLSQKSFALVQALQDGLFWNVKAPLSLLYGAAAGVFLICCLNLSILVSARIEADRRQTVVRLALGASSAQILQRALAPIAIVCGLGTLAAVLTVTLVWKSLLALIPEYLRLVLAGVDSRLVWITCLMASAGAMLAALYPLKRLLRSDSRAILQVGQELPSGRPRMFAVLTGLEATMGTVLLIAGAVTVGGFVKTLWTDLGYQPAGVYVIERGGANTSQFEELGEMLKAVPGVLHVSSVDTPWGTGDMQPIQVKDPSGVEIRFRTIGSHYLEVYRARLLAGQSVSQSDYGVVPIRTVVNESASGIWWRGVPPAAVIGRSLVLSGIGEISVAGVVANTRQRHAVPASPEILIPLENATAGGAKYVVRVIDPYQVTAEDLARQLGRRLNQEGAVMVVPLQRAIDRWLENPRLYAVVLGSFGVVSVLLICVGIASVCAFDIASRRREIALRIALGGSLNGVGALFAKRSLTPLALGLLSGCVLAYWFSAFLGSLVPGLERVNIAVYVVVVLTAVVSGIAAVASPISRAIRTAPIGVLKDD